MKIFILIFFLFTSITTFAENYKNLECKIHGAGNDDIITLHAKQKSSLVNEDEFILSIYEKNVPGIGYISISQSEGSNDVLHVYIRTSDILGLSITSQMILNDFSEIAGFSNKAIGYFQYGSEVHPKVKIQCSASK